MKRLGVLVVLVAILLGGGALTSRIFTDSPSILQSSDPEASVFEATPLQANLIIVWVGFVLFNVLGAGLTLGLVMWRGNIEVRRAQQMAARTDTTALPAAKAGEAANAA